MKRLKNPQVEKTLNSRPSIYLSGVALGFIIATWYRKQTGPANWWVIALGLVLVAIVVLKYMEKK